MGQAKRWQQEQEERGYYDVGKMICPSCLTDECLKQLVLDEARCGKCDYCEASSQEKPIVAPMSVVLSAVYEGITSEWWPPETWDSEEKQWIEGFIDSEDLVRHELNISSNDEVLSDIADALVNDAWCDHIGYGDPPSLELIRSWQGFCDTLMHARRYFTSFGGEGPSLSRIEDGEFSLSDLHRLVEESDMVRELATGTTVYRARIHSPDAVLTRASELGAPPTDLAIQSNRMSPAGISMFYGAFDAATALAETYDPKKDGEVMATIAGFEVLRPIQCIDLTVLPDVPGLFDEDGRYWRTPLKFLHAFVKDASKPIERGDREHVEYVPTQVVTESFREFFQPEGGGSVLGIVYPSAARKGGKSIALFIGNDGAVDELSEGLDYREPVLRLLPGSIVRKRPN